MGVCDGPMLTNKQVNIFHFCSLFSFKNLVKVTSIYYLMFIHHFVCDLATYSNQDDICCRVFWMMVSFLLLLDIVQTQHLYDLMPNFLLMVDYYVVLYI